ncbi:MAG: putative response regulator [Labilithrix sp.]|nr:putative response regulator [Labilithrix sp.]
MLTEQAHSGQNATSSPPSSTTGLRLGGARADFVAGLGRKVTDLRASSARVRESAADIGLREELRRKLHALSSSAKLMKFDAMDRAIAEALGIIDRTDLDVPLQTVDLDAIDQLLEDLPALAWGEGDAGLSRSMPVAKAARTYGALIVGNAQIAEALLDAPADLKSLVDEMSLPPVTRHLTFACESTPDAQAAYDLARTTEPELVVLDADLEYATELVEALMDDPLTEQSPIVVLGSFQEPGEEARYRAMGVAKTLSKPTSKASLRAACEQAIEARRGTLAANARAFPPLSDAAHGDRSRTRLRGPATEVRLSGRKIIVADDDPAVVWFLADLLKASGCIVHEAFDGQQALELAYRTSPDLMLCDIMMPKVDGFSLCRTLRRDVALRDVPVILLSWKDDLLQRVRELGAGAAGYIRKETDTRAIVARIRESLRPRSHIEMRLRDDNGSEVRGRLDGVSVRTLLEIVCATRPSARVALRDASFVYEVDIRDGAPLKATRTSGDGTVLHGTKVLAAMLGAAAGRFTVTNSTLAVDAELDGNLASQLAKPIARARAATSLLVGTGRAKACRVRLDAAGLEDYLRAMPDTMRSLAVRLAEGVTPIALMIEGGSDAALVEDLVYDLAARGVVTAIEDERGTDLLAPEVLRLGNQGDVRAALAPRTATPEPMAATACNDEAAPLCESPDPDSTSASTLGDAVLREVATRSPVPGPMVPRPAPRPHPTATPGAVLVDDGTPTSDQIVAMSEATVVDDTTYAEATPEPSIPVDESIAIPLTERRDARTPLTVVTSTREDEAAAGVPTQRKSWPTVALVAASGVVAWAVVHFAFAAAGNPPAKQVETAPRATTEIVAPSAPEGVTYTAVAAAGLPAGQGMLEISVPNGAVILVDGTDRGRGGVTLPLFAGKHDVRVDGTSNDLAKLVEVRPSLVAHVKF